MRETGIEWCDSTLNLMMGCDGCELASKAGSGTCYAEILTARYGGRKGFPKSFYEPALFPERLAVALRWPDLTGTELPGKPWLNGRPRMIFLDDMGDTFTESLPLDWIAPHVPAMAASPHVWMFLTKRPERMAQFWRAYGPVPANCWLGTSVIASTARVRDLVKIPDATRYLSAEPLWKDLDLRRWLADIALVITGGESGPGAKPGDVGWVRSIIGQCRDAGAAAFVKQLGSAPTCDRALGEDGWPDHVEYRKDITATNVLKLRDRKGGDPSEWPADLRVRMFPGDLWPEAEAE